MILRMLGDHKDLLGNRILELEVRNGSRKTIIVTIKRSGKVDKIYVPRIDMPHVRREIVFRLMTLREPILVDEVVDEWFKRIIEKYLKVLRLLEIS